jgi:ubiquinone/menaquinone biosynthesis C-methylase UbiE
VRSRLMALALVADAFGSAPFNWAYSRAQEPEERQLFNALGVRPGMRVLDVACGGAATTFYLADAVMPNGGVLAIDNDAAHIAYGERQRAAWDASGNLVTYRLQDAEALPDDLGVFDFIWISQVLMFFADPIAVLQRLVSRHLAPGGLIAVRGWLDGAEHHHDFRFDPLGNGQRPGLMECFWDAYNTVVNAKMERRLTALCAARGMDHLPAGVSVLVLLSAAGLECIELVPESIVRRPPLGEWDRRFLAGRLRWMVEGSGAREHLACDDWDRLREVADPQHPDYLLCRSDFLYRSFGLVAVGRKPGR